MELVDCNALNDLKEYQKSFENNNKNFDILLSIKSENLIIKIRQVNSFPLNNYESVFSKNDLNELSKYFRMFDDINDLFPDLIYKLENNEFKIIEKRNSLQLYIYINITNISNASLPIKKVNVSLSSTVETLCKMMNKILEENNELKNYKIKKEKQFNELKNEVLILKKDKEERDKKEKEENEKLEKEEKIINGNFSDSSILKANKEKIMVINWIKPNAKVKFELLYKSSRDGDQISTFYQKVAGKSLTLVVIESTIGYKFGGFTSIEWKNYNNYAQDNSAFIFSINYNRKYEIRNDKIGNAIYGNSNCFAFGGGHDINIVDQCTSNNNNQTMGSHTFKASNFELNGGVRNFCVKECEVYQVIYQ